jgi:hemerythrin-like domain-containing protein
MIVNKQEEVQNLLTAAEHLSEDYVTRKLLEILGDIDKVDEVMEQKLVDETSRYRNELEEEETDETEPTE